MCLSQVYEGSLNVFAESEAGPFNGFTRVSGSTGDEFIGLHQVLTDGDEASVDVLQVGIGDRFWFWILLGD